MGQTTDAAIKAQLLDTFISLAPEVYPTETFVADLSRVDIDKLGCGKTYNQLREALNALNKSKPNNIKDALIGEVAILQGLTLITADKDLAKVVEERGGSVLHLAIAK